MATESIRKEIIKNIDKQCRKGMKKYGKPLTIFDGRDPIQDAIEELIDLLFYLTKEQIERRKR